MKSYFRLLSYAGNLRTIAVPFVITSLIAAVFGVLNLVLLKPLLDILFGQVSQAALEKMAVKPQNLDLLAYFNYYFAQIFIEKGKLGGLQFVCVVIVVGILISNVFRYLSMRILESFKVNMVANLRQAVFDKAITLPMSFYSNERKGNLISRIITDVQEVENSIASSFSAATKEFLLLLGYLTALFMISVKLSLFALIVIPITGAFLGIILKRMRQDAGDSQVRLSNLISLMDEAFGGMRVVKGFVAEKFISNKFKIENQGYKRSVFAYGSKREMANPFSEFIGVTMVASLLLYGGTMILSGESQLTASMFIAFIVVFSQVVRPAKEISQAFGSSQRGIASGERILEILDTPNTINESKNAIQHPAFEESIRFENVSFAYNDDKMVLKNINFELKKGKTLALVGSSGGGKSTIADLIPRFYDPIEGIIKIDGLDCKDLSQNSLRKLMGIVTQEPILFNDTIYNNIAFGIDTTEQKVMEAAKIANAHDFIISQTEGYQTIIGDRGSKLSGGQRQRLSIARAILQNPPILILDEATSALDTESEKLVQDALLKLMQNRTSLVIAHRLSTIQKADEILVIVDGEIHERGSHSQLINKDDGFYKKLVLMQEM